MGRREWGLRVGRRTLILVQFGDDRLAFEHDFSILQAKIAPGLIIKDEHVHQLNTAQLVTLRSIARVPRRSDESNIFINSKANASCRSPYDFVAWGDIIWIENFKFAGMCARSFNCDTGEGSLCGHILYWRGISDERECAGGARVAGKPLRCGTDLGPEQVQR